MNEFEKWYKKDREFFESGRTFQEENKYHMSQGWKAALEWALTNRISGIENDGTISYMDWIDDGAIKQELGDTNE